MHQQCQWSVLLQCICFYGKMPMDTRLVNKNLRTLLRPPLHDPEGQHHLPFLRSHKRLPAGLAKQMMSLLMYLHDVKTMWVLPPR